MENERIKNKIKDIIENIFEGDWNIFRLEAEFDEYLRRKIKTEDDKEYFLNTMIDEIDLYYLDHKRICDKKNCGYLDLKESMIRIIKIEKNKKR